MEDELRASWVSERFLKLATISTTKQPGISRRGKEGETDGKVSILLNLSRIL